MAYTMPDKQTLPFASHIGTINMRQALFWSIVFSFKMFHLRSTGISCTPTFTGIFQEDNIPDIEERDNVIMMQCPVSWSGETEIRISKRMG